MLRSTAGGWAAAFAGSAVTWGTAVGTVVGGQPREPVGQPGQSDTALERHQQANQQHNDEATIGRLHLDPPS